MIFVFWFIPVWVVKWIRFSTHFSALLPEFVNVFSRFNISCGEQAICMWRKSKTKQHITKVSKRSSRECCIFCMCENLTLENVQLLLEIISTFIQIKKKRKSLNDFSPQLWKLTLNNRWSIFYWWNNQRENSLPRVIYFSALGYISI